VTSGETIIDDEGEVMDKFVQGPWGIRGNDRSSQKKLDEDQAAWTREGGPGSNLTVWTEQEMRERSKVRGVP